ncbi:hypothetical protein CMI37_12530 [Candidatus Pacearchaeota archaeon]|nr:hypothetical protein [Candidatus Pacearchaeota archaeon]
MIEGEALTLPKWMGWLTMDALTRAEAHFEQRSEGGADGVFELALTSPRKYGGSMLHLYLTSSRTACGTPAPSLDSPVGTNVCDAELAFWTYEWERIEKCKRCTKKEAEKVEEVTS